MEKEFLKLKPDYQCYPIWKIEANSVENVNPDELPITRDLKESLANWQRTYDQTLNWDNPIASGFKSDEEESLFDEEGFMLWKRLSEELSTSISVKYYSVRTNVLYEAPF